MVEVTVDQKPMPQNPIDPSVIPEAVKRRAAAVDALYAANGQAAAAQTQEPPKSPQAQEVPPQADGGSAPQGPAPSSPAVQLELPMETKSDPRPKRGAAEDDNYERKFLRMKGQYDASQRTIGEMQDQMQQMGDELLRMQQHVRQTPQSPQQETPAFRYYLTEQDVQNYGPELIDFTQRAAQQVFEPQLSKLEEENQQLRSRLAREARRALDERVEEAIPNYREIDRNPRWHNWLRLPDLLSGRIRQELLNDAANASNATRVIGFFRSFLAEEAATGHSDAAPSSPPARAAAREPVIPMQTLAAPGSVRPAGGGESSLPPDKPHYTRDSIKQFYRDKARGAYAGREQEALAIERDIVRAPLEGRYRG